MRVARENVQIQVLSLLYVKLPHMYIYDQSFLCLIFSLKNVLAERQNRLIKLAKEKAQFPQGRLKVCQRDISLRWEVFKLARDRVHASESQNPEAKQGSSVSKNNVFIELATMYKSQDDLHRFRAIRKSVVPLLHHGGLLALPGCLGVVLGRPGPVRRRGVLEEGRRREDAGRHACALRDSFYLQRQTCSNP